MAGVCRAEKTRARPGFLVTRAGSAVLADTGDQPGLVVAVDALHAPAFAEGLALVEARGLGHAAEGQGGDRLVGQLVDAVTKMQAD